MTGKAQPATLETIASSIDRLEAAQRTTGDKLGRLGEEVAAMRSTFDERTRDMATNTGVDAKIAARAEICMGKRLEREIDDSRSIRSLREPVSYPPRSRGKAKLAGAVGGAGLGLGALGVALWKLLEFLSQ